MLRAFAKTVKGRSLALLLAAGVLAAVGTSVAFALAEGPPPRQICFRLTVLEGPPGQREKSKVLAEPSLTTIENSTATFFSGGEDPKRKVFDHAPEVRWGTRVELHAGTIRQGKVPIDLLFQQLERRESPEDSVVLEGRTQRVIQTVEVGKSFSTAVADSTRTSQVWIEVTPTEIQRESDPKASL